MNLKFYRCSVCGQVIAIVNDTGMPIRCCGKEMEMLVPNTTDAMEEKHIPTVKKKDNMVYVTIGEEDHPMEKDHHIEWVAIETHCGNQRKPLMPGKEPKVCFSLCEGDEVKTVYAYCNKHGLWKSNK